MGVRISLPLQKLNEKMKSNYFKESYIELVQKVSWPSFSSLRSSAIVVMVASAIIAVVVLIMDLAFENIMRAIYSQLF